MNLPSQNAQQFKVSLLPSPVTEFQSSDKVVCSGKEKPPPASKPADYNSD